MMEPAEEYREPAGSAADVAALAAEQDPDLRTALAELGALALSLEPLPEMLAHVAQFAVDAVATADGAGLTLLREDKAETVVVSHEFVTKIEAVQYGIGEGPCITAADEARTVRVADLDQDQMWPRFSVRARRLGVHSALSVPLLVGDEVIGAINLYAHARNTFDDRAARMAELFAVPAAAAVQIARDLTRARELAGQLETALTSRATIDQAIGVIVARTGCTPEAGFDRLRKISQTENRRLALVAERVLAEAIRSARARLAQHAGAD